MMVRINERLRLKKFSLYATQNHLISSYLLINQCNLAMKPILSFLLSFLLVNLSLAQKTRDVLFLNNGSIIRGNITEQNDTVVKIITCCESILVYKNSEIMKIVKEKTGAFRKMNNKGYINLTSFGVLIGSSDDQKTAPFSVIMEHNYRFNKSIASGGFVGFEQLHENLLPLGANLKLLLPVGRSDFFVDLLGGYSISLEKPGETGIKKASGGLLAGTELGILIPVSRGTGLVLSMGYRYNKLTYKLEDWYYGDIQRNIAYNRFVLRFGISIF
jgi:hypothetical protein